MNETFLEEEMSYTAEEKEMWLEDWKQSGKGAWTYAKENGLVPQTFCGWIKKESRKRNSFIEIHTKAIVPTSVIIIEKEDIKIHLPLGMSREVLRTVIEELGLVQ